jgi:uncharacterized protein YjbI with pentapeptide repeats
MEEKRPQDMHDRQGWRDYWDTIGQSWRTEPEIHPERQRMLAERRAAQGAANTTPFAGMRLDRGDIEWLLATHQSRGSQGPVDAEDAAQRMRDGINLQGADLRQAKLGGLPLARANLSNARLDKANFNQAHLERANFANSQMQGTVLTKAWATDASFRQANLQDAILADAHLESANLYQANCRNATFYIAHLDEAYLGQANLGQATIRRAFFDSGTSWNDTILWDEQHVAASLADARWNDTNLATIDWSQVRMIGDERDARSRIDRDGKPKTPTKWRDNYRRAVRANRQLAVTLRSQGMNEEADRFAYRAQVCQRILYRRQGKLVAAFGSGFLDMLSGYGYKPIRILLVYILIILGFTGGYLLVGNATMSPIEALIFSITSFHGRGFFPTSVPLDVNVTLVAAVEAIIGLIIEGSFIAMFTQRFFSR